MQVSDTTDTNLSSVTYVHVYMKIVTVMHRLGQVKKILVSRPLNIEKVMRASNFYFSSILFFLQGQI